MATGVTICALFYGDYPDLAKRLLLSLGRAWYPGAFDVRFGLNEVAPRTRQEVYGWQEQFRQRQGNCQIYESVENIHKYPLMRRMLYEVRVTTPYVMWFDDDSFLHDDVTNAWILGVERAMQQADMLGAIYSIPYQPAQRDWIRDQPWYRGKLPASQGKFCTGGWWTIRSELLYRYNYPWPCLDHRGGDVMLGECLRQNNHVLRSFTSGVSINAGADGKNCTSPRRGFDSKPIGADYQRSAAHKLVAPSLPVSVPPATTPPAPPSASPRAKPWEAFL